VNAARVDFILDNGGQELVCDLLLALNLIGAGKSVRFHAKRHPFYVSDAQVKDVRAAISASRGPGPGAFGGGERAFLVRRGRGARHRRPLLLERPVPLPRSPRALARELRRSDLVILKGT